MRTAICLAITLTISCNDPEPGAAKTPPAGAPTTAPGGKGPELPGVISVAEGSKLCAALVPQGSRAGLEVTGGGIDGTLTCNLERSKKLVASMMLDCSRGVAIDDVAQKPGQLSGLGRAAYTASNGPVFFATRVDCIVKMMGFDPGFDAARLAPAVDAALTSKTAPLPTAPTGGLGLRCDDVVPAAVRGRLGTDKRAEQRLVDGKLSCRYEGSRKTFWVHLECPPDARHELELRRDGQKRLERYLGEVDVGSGGFRESGDQINFIDPQTECVADLALLTTEAIDRVALARDIEEAITPDSIR